MAKINTPQIITMVAIFAALIGLIIFMRRNDKKEEFTGSMKAAMDNARAAARAAAAKSGDRDAAARAAQAQAAAAAAKAKKMFR